jgi:hypothetical protein
VYVYGKISIEDKYTLVKSHILSDYYTLPSLQSSVSIFKFPTLVTLDRGLGKFLLNISNLNGSVFEFDTTIVRANITWTIYDHEPNVIIYAVSNVLFLSKLFRPPPPPVSSEIFPLPMYFYSFLVFLFLIFYY